MARIIILLAITNYIVELHTLSLHELRSNFSLKNSTVGANEQQQVHFKNPNNSLQQNVFQEKQIVLERTNPIDTEIVHDEIPFYLEELGKKYLYHFRLSIFNLLIR